MPIVPAPKPPSKLTPKAELASDLHEAIAQMRKIVDRIRDPAARQYEILDFIASRTDSDRILLDLTNPLGACIGIMILPYPSEEMLPAFEYLGPAFFSLGLCDEIWQHSWHQPVGKAFLVDVELWQTAPTYHMIYSKFGHDHVLLGKVANRDNGNQLLVCPMRCNLFREHRDPKRKRWLNQPEAAKLRGIPDANSVHKFTKEDARKLAAILDEFIPELAARNPLGEFSPEPSKTVVETIKLDAALVPIVVPPNKEAMSPYAEALISRFYGIVSRDGQQRPRLPLLFKNAITTSIEKARKEHGYNKNVLEFLLKANYRGRLLTVAGEHYPDKTTKIRLTEITDHHTKLTTYILKSRSPSPVESQRVFEICLLMEDGIKEQADVADSLELDKEQAEGQRFTRQYNKAKNIVFET